MGRSEDLFIGKILSEPKYGGTGFIPEKTEALYIELYERAGAATSSYSTAGNFSQYIYSLLVAKNQKKIRSRCLVHEFSFTDINHGYWVAILKKNYLWLLLLFRQVLHTKLTFSQKLTPCPHNCFHLKPFLWKGPLTVKVRKKFIDQILSYISFCFEIRAHLGHLFA